MNVGEKIKKIREFRNFTQDYMAKQLDITQAGYSRIEANLVDIPFSRIEQIAKVLNVSLVEIVGFDGKNIFNSNFTNTTNGFVLGANEHLQDIKNQYESRIASLETEIIRLHNLLEKALNK
ncbi:MAG: helix-turn-helix domain-containing protein [Bacteroidetes bacterium]|nr:MAG: helix-turn-helix domain-containing protein [Bacteroidota bacterium]